MKPVTRVSHVLMAPVIVDDRRALVLVSRMIYSSHYFRDGLEVRGMVPADQSPDPKAFYLAMHQPIAQRVADRVQRIPDWRRRSPLRARLDGTLHRPRPEMLEIEPLTLRAPSAR